MCVIPGKKSIKVASSIDFLHIFFRKSLVTPSGLSGILSWWSLTWDTFSISPLASGCGISPRSTSLCSYSSSSLWSLARNSCLDLMFWATHKSHRTPLRLAVFSLSAIKQSLQIRLGTPHVGHRRFPRNLSHGLWHASHLLIGWGSTSPRFSCPSMAAGLWANRLSNTWKKQMHKWRM